MLFAYNFLIGAIIQKWAPNQTYSKLHLQVDSKFFFIEWIRRSFYQGTFVLELYSKAFTITTTQYFSSTLLWIWIKYGFTRFLLMVHKQTWEKMGYPWNKKDNKQIAFVVSFVYKWKTCSIPVHRYNNSMLYLLWMEVGDFGFHLDGI